MTRPIRKVGTFNAGTLFYTGWAGIAAFGGVILTTNGSEALGLTAILVGVAVAMCFGFWLTEGTVVPVVSLVLGVLVGAVLAAWLADDASSGESGRAVGDAVGLLGALLVVAGAATHLRRHPRP